MSGVRLSAWGWRCRPNVMIGSLDNGVLCPVVREGKLVLLGRVEEKVETRRQDTEKTNPQAVLAMSNLEIRY